MKEPQPQASSAILMIRPAAFGFNNETADDNAFGAAPQNTNPDLSKQAQLEFDHMVATLKEAHIDVIVIEDGLHPLKPDAVFPNNWFSTHADGTLVTYPMYSPIRRQERSQEVLKYLEKNYHVIRKLPLEASEARQEFLEGTGSIVFDHLRRRAYACRSKRTDEELLKKISQQLGYKPVLFNAWDENGRPIYHTNVMLSITTRLVIVCLETLDAAEEEDLLEELMVDKELLVVDQEQMKNFCCNVLEVKNKAGESYLAMSTRAYSAFDHEQIALINKFHKIVHYPLTQIENIGGGGSRCMMAEIFLARRS